MTADRRAGATRVLKVGAEGGSIELERRDGEPPRFRTRVVDVSGCLYEVGGEPQVREGPWLPLDAALAELEATAWRALYPLELHPDLRRRVWTQLERVVGRTTVRHRARWESLCSGTGAPD